jgi:hypothetical protein
MIKEQVKIVVTTTYPHYRRERLCTLTTITSDGSYQGVDDEVKDFVYSEFRDYPAQSILNISWMYV